MARLFFTFFYFFVTLLLLLLLLLLYLLYGLFVSQYRGVFYQELLPWVYFGSGLGRC